MFIGVYFHGGSQFILGIGAKACQKVTPIILGGLSLDWRALQPRPSHLQPPGYGCLVNTPRAG